MGRGPLCASRQQAQAPLGLVGAMALDPAVAAGVAVGCILFLIVVIFVFIKVSCAPCSRHWEHAHQHRLPRTSDLCVCVFLCVAPPSIVHSHTRLISTSFSSLRSHCSQPFASHRTSMMARRLAFTLDGWFDTQWDKAVSRSCAQAKDITLCFPLSLSRAAHIHCLCVAISTFARC